MFANDVKRLGFSFPIDFWALGIMCFQLMVGELPFDAKTKTLIVRKIKAAKFERKPFNSYPAALDLIICLLKPKSSLRLGSIRGAAEVKEKLFFRDLNWETVQMKGYEPPYLPHQTNTSYLGQFGEELTWNNFFQSIPPSRGKKSDHRLLSNFTFSQPPLRPETPDPEQHESERHQSQQVHEQPEPEIPQQLEQEFNYEELFQPVLGTFFNSKTTLNNPKIEFIGRRIICPICNHDSALTVQPRRSAIYSDKMRKPSLVTTNFTKHHFKRHHKDFMLPVLD